MNAYKLAWLQEQAVGYGQGRAIQRMRPKTKKKGGRTRATGPGVLSIAARQKAEGMVMSGGYQLAKHASQTQIAGRAGMALRMGGRIGVRVIPIVGAAMLAYDLYQFGSWLLED